MRILYHLIGIAMVLVIMARLEDDIASPEPEDTPAQYSAASSQPDGPAAVSLTPANTGSPVPEMAMARTTFMGKPCLQSDCAGNLAGYRWAEENSINKPVSCEVLEGEFANGCRLYARTEQKYNI